MALNNFLPIFLSNGLVAIVPGLFGNLLVDTMSLGPVSPFDATACFLAIGMAVIPSSWGENYGDPSENKDLLTQFNGAAVAIASEIKNRLPISYITTPGCDVLLGFSLYGLCRSDEKIALFGAIQSLFEGSMYTFVFLWTPALSPNEEDIPHGFIFATFMLASILGSTIASRLMARTSLRVESYMQIVFVVSAASLRLPIVTTFLVAPSKVEGGSISFAGCIQLIGFCTFEACVGIFWPSIVKMRSQYIPEEARSTIMNFFCIPLNIFIVFVVSAASLRLPIVTTFLVAPSKVEGGSISFAGCIQLIGFCTFEACVGIFWPSIVKMRSQYIPEEARSTIMNFFRIPLNIFVCIVLYNVCLWTFYPLLLHLKTALCS
ncbi:unnamed protein product [Ilex paraguariensis]|uniref:Uncharacterized protein n=1 Tax=Ilex paraguariensis TaxID=185542 RepID=A0ABC8S322_9AQUA